MPGYQRKGPLESIDIRLEKDKGEEFKKMVDAAKSILDSIGTSSAVASDSKK